MLASKQVARGFTLVEILIVVVILGILAAIVIPQFTSASETAKASSLVTQLQTIRSQLELYQVQHNGVYPTIVADTNWNKMTAGTDVLGAPGTDFGPYLQQAPANAFQPSATATSAAAAAAAGVGWEYIDATGAIRAVLPATVFAQAASLGLDTTNDVVSEP